MSVKLALSSLTWHGEERAVPTPPLRCCHTCVSTEGTSLNAESPAMMLGSGREAPGTMTVDVLVSINLWNTGFSTCV